MYGPTVAWSSDDVRSRSHYYVQAARKSCHSKQSCGFRRRTVSMPYNVSSVVEFQRWCVLESKIFGQKSTCLKEIIEVRFASFHRKGNWQNAPLCSMLIFEQQSYCLGPTIFEIPHPKWNKIAILPSYHEFRIILKSHSNSWT